MKKLVLFIIIGIFVLNGLSASAINSNQCTTVASNVTENNPPGTPTIKGPTSGKSGTTYTYTISAIDPDGDQITYCLNWSDNTGEACIGPYASGEEVKVTHAWTAQGTYKAKVKARDINNAESDWATLTVSMPYSDNSIPQVLQWLFQRFPHVFPLLRQLMGD